MLKRIPWWVRIAVIIAVLLYAASYNATPATPTPNCLTVPADGQPHPCSVPDPPATAFTVTARGAYQTDGDCWTLTMNRPLPGGAQSLRTCVPKADYDAHPVGSTYTVGGPGTGLPGGTATRITDGG
jgi:hypothetical protein